MARCQTGHETANTDFCDICGARVSGTPGFGQERGGGKHRGADRSPVSDGRICPGCGAPAPGPFCDACGLRLRGHGAFGAFGAPEEEYPSARASSAPPESLFPPVTRPGASSSPWGPPEPPSPWNSPSQQAPAQQAWAQQAPAEPPSSWSQATQAQAEPPAPWNLPADQPARRNATAERPSPWNATAEPAAPWNTPAERPAAWAPPPQAPSAPSAPSASPADSRSPAPADTGAVNLLESLFSPEPPAAPIAGPAGPLARPAVPPASPASQPATMAPPTAPAQVAPSASMAPPAAPPRAGPPAMPAAAAPPAPAPAPAPPVVSAAPPTRPIPALAVTWTVLVASDRAYYDMMKSVRDQRGPDVAFPALPGQRRIRLTGDKMRIGRRSATRELKPEIDLAEHPVDPGVSRLHAVLIATSDGNWSILDPGSANGTLLNGREIPAGEQIPLHEGDRINLGAWTVISMHRS